MNYTKKIIFFAFLIAQMHRSLGVVSLDLTSEGAKVIAPAIKEAALQVGSDAAKTIAPSIREVAEAFKKIEPALVNGGVEAAKLLAPAIENSTEKLAASSAILAAALKQASLDAGTNVGLGTLQAIGTSMTSAGASIKATAITIACAPATPYIVGGVGLVIIGYSGYRLYYYFRPTPEQKAKQDADNAATLAKIKFEIAKSQTATAALNAAHEKALKDAATFNAAHEKVLKETEFKKALIQNASSTQRTASGIPVACQKQAHELAIVAGQKKVDKIVSAFNKYGPQAAAMAARA